MPTSLKYSLCTNDMAEAQKGSSFTSDNARIQQWQVSGHNLIEDDAKTFKHRTYLSQGAFGQVYKVQVNNQAMIFKSCRTTDQSSLAQRVFINECSILAVLNRDHIRSQAEKYTASRVLGVSSNCIAFAFCENYGDLWTVLAEVYKTKRDLGVQTKISYSGQLLNAVAFLTTHGIEHRDLKPENILVTSKGLKIIDFGAAVFRDKELFFTKLAPNDPVGTCGYSPEYPMLNGNQNREFGEIDAFSVSCVIAEIWQGIALHGDDNSATYVWRQIGDKIEAMCSSQGTNESLFGDLARVLFWAKTPVPQYFKAHPNLSFVDKNVFASKEISTVAEEKAPESLRKVQNDTTENDNRGVARCIQPASSESQDHHRRPKVSLSFWQRLFSSCFTSSINVRQLKPNQVRQASVKNPPLTYPMANVSQQSLLPACELLRI